MLRALSLSKGRIFKKQIIVSFDSIILMNPTLFGSTNLHLINGSKVKCNETPIQIIDSFNKAMQAQEKDKALAGGKDNDVKKTVAPPV